MPSTLATALMKMDRKNEHSQKALDDMHLVKLALEGNEGAFARLLLKYKDPIYYLILRIVKNQHDAEDLAVESFGKAFANLHVYSNEYAFSTWLYKIATNNSIDFLRKKKGVHYSIDQSSELEQDELALNLRSNVPDPEEKLILKQRRRTLQRLIQKLPVKYQKLINLRYFKEYSYEEIAKELALPLGTVKVQLFRARNKLFDAIGDVDLKA